MANRGLGWILPHRDARFLSKLSGRFHLKTISNVLLFERPTDAGIDEIYGEGFPDFFLWNRYAVPIHTTWEPQDDTFKKEGLNETRPVRFALSPSAFEQLRAPTPAIGSVFVIEGEFYRINDIAQTRYVGTTGVQVQLVGNAWKIHPSSIPGAFEPTVPLNSVNKNTLLLPIRDTAFLASGQADLFRRAFGRVSFFIRSRDFTTKTYLDSKGLAHPERFREELRSPSPNMDSLYNEETGEYRIPGTQYDIPAYVRVDPPKYVLKKYGMETTRDVMVFLSLELMDNLGLDVLPNYGDIFTYEGEYYLITDQDPTFYFSNTEQYMAILCFGRKLRQSSLELAPLTQPTTPPGEGYQKPAGELDVFSNDLYGEKKL